MAPLSEGVVKRNREYWDRTLEGTLMTYEDFLDGKTIQDIRAMQENNQLAISMEEFVSTAVSRAFELLMADGYEEQAQHALNLAEQGAKIALQEREFDCALGSPQQLSEREYQIYLAQGHSQLYFFLHHAIWFQTGVRSQHLLEQCAEWRMKRYALVRWPQILEEMLPILVEAEEYATAMELYEEHHSPIVKTPSRSKNLSQAQTLYVLARYAAGDESWRDVAQPAIEGWYSESVDWTWKSGGMVWWDRLSWVYLRDRHFDRLPDLKDLLRQLKACD
jgi:hypothetical protein